MAAEIERKWREKNRYKLQKLKKKLLKRKKERRKRNIKRSKHKRRVKEKQEDAVIDDDGDFESENSLLQEDEIKKEIKEEPEVQTVSKQHQVHSVLKGANQVRTVKIAPPPRKDVVTTRKVTFSDKIFSQPLQPQQPQPPSILVKRSETRRVGVRAPPPQGPTVPKTVTFDLTSSSTPNPVPISSVPKVAAKPSPQLPPPSPPVVKKVEPPSDPRLKSSAPVSQAPKVAQILPKKVVISEKPKVILQKPTEVNVLKIVELECKMNLGESVTHPQPQQQQVKDVVNKETQPQTREETVGANKSKKLDIKAYKARLLEKQKREKEAAERIKLGLPPVSIYETQKEQIQVQKDQKQEAQFQKDQTVDPRVQKNQILLQKDQKQEIQNNQKSDPKVHKPHAQIQKDQKQEIQIQKGQKLDPRIQKNQAQVQKDQKLDPRIHKNQVQIQNDQKLEAQVQKQVVKTQKDQNLDPRIHKKPIQVQKEHDQINKDQNQEIQAQEDQIKRSQLLDPRLRKNTVQDEKDQKENEAQKDQVQHQKDQQRDPRLKKNQIQVEKDQESEIQIPKDQNLETQIPKDQKLETQILKDQIQVQKDQKQVTQDQAQTDHKRNLEVQKDEVWVEKNQKLETQIQKDQEVETQIQKSQIEIQTKQNQETQIQEQKGQKLDFQSPKCQIQAGRGQKFELHVQDLVQNKQKKELHIHKEEIHVEVQNDQKVESQVQKGQKQEIQVQIQEKEQKQDAPVQKSNVVKLNRRPASLITPANLPKVTESKPMIKPITLIRPKITQPISIKDEDDPDTLIITEKIDLLDENDDYVPRSCIETEIVDLLPSMYTVAEEVVVEVDAVQVSDGLPDIVPDEEMNTYFNKCVLTAELPKVDISGTKDLLAKLETRSFSADELQIGSKINKIEFGSESVVSVSDIEVNLEKTDVPVQLYSEDLEIEGRLDSEKSDIPVKLDSEEPKIQVEVDSEKSDVPTRVDSEITELEVELNSEKPEVSVELDSEKSKIQVKLDSESIEKNETVVELVAEMAKNDIISAEQEEKLLGEILSCEIEKELENIRVQGLRTEIIPSNSSEEVPLEDANSVDMIPVEDFPTMIAHEEEIVDDIDSFQPTIDSDSLETKLQSVFDEEEKEEMGKDKVEEEKIAVVGEERMTPQEILPQPVEENLPVVAESLESQSTTDVSEIIKDNDSASYSKEQIDVENLDDNAVENSMQDFVADPEETLSCDVEKVPEKELPTLSKSPFVTQLELNIEKSLEKTPTSEPAFDLNIKDPIKLTLLTLDANEEPILLMKETPVVMNCPETKKGNDKEINETPKEDIVKKTNKGKSKHHSSSHRVHKRKHKSKSSKINIPKKVDAQTLTCGDLVKNVTRLNSKQNVMARMLEIDLEVKKLMDEKMELHKILMKGDFEEDKNQPQEKGQLDLEELKNKLNKHKETLETEINKETSEDDEELQEINSKKLGKFKAKAANMSNDEGSVNRRSRVTSKFTV